MEISKESVLLYRRSTYLNALFPHCVYSQELKCKQFSIYFYIFQMELKMYGQR